MDDDGRRACRPGYSCTQNTRLKPRRRRRVRPAPEPSGLFPLFQVPTARSLKRPFRQLVSVVCVGPTRLLSCSIIALSDQSLLALCNNNVGFLFGCVNQPLLLPRSLPAQVRPPVVIVLLLLLSITIASHPADTASKHRPQSVWTGKATS